MIGDSITKKKNNDSLNTHPDYNLSFSLLSGKDITYLLDHDIISMDDVAQPQEALMAKIIENVHTHAITKLKDGRYATWIPDPSSLI